MTTESRNERRILSKHRDECTCGIKLDKPMLHAVGCPIYPGYIDVSPVFGQSLMDVCNTVFARGDNAPVVGRHKYK